MSPRRGRRRPERESGRSGSARGSGPAARGSDEDAPRTGPSFETVEEHPDGDWVVRSIRGSSSTKPYRCPGCDQEIYPATPHLVVWPAQGYGSVEDRRHWHKTCWGARNKRRPNTVRSRNAPKH